MKSLWRKFALIAGLIVSLSACSANDSVSGDHQAIKLASPGEEQIVEIVWQALEPNTSSHDQTEWELVEVRAVNGREVLDLFEGEPAPGNCVPGPNPPDNARISLNGSYWYVQMKPRFATPLPQPTEQFSPTAPPKVPEPFLYQAHFLIDSRSGEVVARKLHCVIY